MHDEVHDVDRWQIAAEHVPPRAAVGGHIHTEVIRCVEDVRAHGIFANHVDRPARQIARDALERLPVVSGLVETNGKILVVAALLRDIHRLLVELGREHFPDPFLLR